MGVGTGCPPVVGQLKNLSGAKHNSFQLKVQLQKFGEFIMGFPNPQKMAHQERSKIQEQDPPVNSHPLFELVSVIIRLQKGSLSCLARPYAPGVQNHRYSSWKSWLVNRYGQIFAAAVCRNIICVFFSTRSTTPPVSTKEPSFDHCSHRSVSKLVGSQNATTAAARACCISCLVD